MYEFRIFYGDRSEFSNEDGTIFDASGRNVQAIAQSDPRGWHVVSHAHYYVWREDMCFYGVDFTGLIDYLMDPGVKCVMVGRTIHTPVFNEIFQKALAYADKKRREVECRSMRSTVGSRV